MSTDDEPLTEPLPVAQRPPFIARMVRLLAVPIILGWLAITVILTIVGTS
ncbi:hypothetical protein [Mycolicibacterium alvei]|nr:hypothetical protein [Mycolicibacterium alvei]MCV6999928.1 hypothetical protein [Mycolicibacterium alvei]